VSWAIERFLIKRVMPGLYAQELRLPVQRATAKEV